MRLNVCTLPALARWRIGSSTLPKRKVMGQAGYDILSFEKDGRERFIEVKTTAYISETPFYVSRNELSFSTEQAERFRLYRLFNFRKRPQMFALAGALDASCRLDPVSYRAEVMARE